MNAKLRRAFEHAGFTVTTVERDGMLHTWKRMLDSRAGVW